MSHEFEDFPVITEELITALDSRFPDKIPLESTSLEEFCRLQGQISVVRLLKDVRGEQNDNILTGGY